MNEIVIKDEEGYEANILTKIGLHNDDIIRITVTQRSNNVYMLPSEALQLADAIYKLLNEPTREQCFEAGRTYSDNGAMYEYDTLTDYINECKKEK